MNDIVLDLYTSMNVKWWHKFSCQSDTNYLIPKSIESQLPVDVIDRKVKVSFATFSKNDSTCCIIKYLEMSKLKFYVNISDATKTQGMPRRIL